MTEVIHAVQFKNISSRQWAPSNAIHPYRLPATPPKSPPASQAPPAPSAPRAARCVKPPTPPPPDSRREDRPPLLDGLHHCNIADLRRWDLQWVTVQDNQISELADFKRALRLLLADLEGCVGGDGP